MLTSTGGTGCSWQTVGGASVDNNTLKNAAYIADLSGSANTISGTTATTFPGAYAAGQSVIVKVANTNTGATTININTLGAKAVTKNGNTALAAGNLVAGNDYLMTYDGTEFEVLTFTVLAVDIPTLNQNTTGNAATATNLASYPTICSGGQFSQGLSSGSNNCATPSGGGGGTPGGTSGQVQYNNSGSFGGFTVSGDGTLNTSTGALVVTKINGTTPGNSCTNQAVTAISSSAVPTCTTLTSAYVNNSIALTGTDVNTSNQVTATHLSAALPVNQGGTGTTSTLTGLVRGSASAMTAAELSGDVTTSGSNAATVVKVNGGSVPASAKVVGTNSSSQPIAAALTSAHVYVGNGSNLPADVAVSGDVTLANTGAATVGGINSVPLCTGFTPTTLQFLQYTTASSPNPCYTAAAASAGGTTIWTGFSSPIGGDVAPHNMMSNTAPSPYVASCTSKFNSSGDCYAAFSSSAGAGWQSATNPTYPTFLELDLGAGNTTVLGNYSINALVNPGYQPNTWQMQGSNDNSTWNTVDSESGQTWTTNQTKNFVCSVTTTAYRYFRVLTSVGNSSVYTIIGQLYLFAQNFTSGTAGDFYYSTGFDQFFGPRTAGGSPLWPPQSLPNFSGVISNGTTFTASGCSNSALVGGATAGSFTSGTTGTCTVVITPGILAPHGWACRAADITTSADLLTQTATTTSTFTLSGATVSADVVNFSCVGY